MTKMVNIKIVLYALVAVFLVVILGVLFTQTRRVDFGVQNEIFDTLRELKQVDAEWDVDLLRSKTGLADNYDAVTNPPRLIQALKANLVAESQKVWHGHPEVNARFDGLLEKYSVLMDKKISMIEHFKSQNAILRNSSRFLPLAVGDLTESVRASNGVSVPRTEIESEINKLLADVMLYLTDPEADLRDRIDQSIRALGQLTLPLRPEVRERNDILATHVGVLLKQQDSGAKLLAELDEIPTAKAIDTLNDAYVQENANLLAGQQIYNQALLVYAISLLLLLAYAGWRIFHSYKLLNKTNAELNRANREIKESQVMLVQTEKMSALGRMVAGIAHEINTPLAYVKGAFGVISDQLMLVRELIDKNDEFIRHLRAAPQDKTMLKEGFLSVEAKAKEVAEHSVLEEIEALLKEGVHGIGQISEIIMNLKNFSRLDRAKIENFSVEAGLDSTLLLAKNILKSKVQIIKQYGNVPLITGSPSQINQVFLNIITNAVQAMSEREGASTIRLRTALEDEQTVRIAIGDNGNGIPEEILPHIFDPFFTSKPVGEGTGMGLSISYKIIQEHGGKILVDTEVGIGTVFTILLPIKAASAGSALLGDDAPTDRLAIAV